MSERPFMQLYVADYLGDTRHLTTEQHGAYLLLLMTMWRHGGKLPNDHGKLARIAGVSPRRWHLIAEDILAFFNEGDGWLTSKHTEQWARDFIRYRGRTPLSAEIRSTVLQRDNGRCRYCGTFDGPWHVDHVYPVALGGSDDLENLVLACAPCNLAKGAKTLEVWLS